MLNFNGTAQNVTKSNPFRQRSHGGGNCSVDGGAHEGEPALHPTPHNRSLYNSHTKSGRQLQKRDQLSLTPIKMIAKLEKTPRTT